MEPDITMYRLKPGHSLPSCSLGCLYLEGYIAMVLSPQRFTTVDCTWETSSPSGRLPCVELTDGSLICRLTRHHHDIDGIEEAEYIISRMHGKGLLPPVHLDDEHRAVSEGFVSLLKHTVVPAIQSSLWTEDACYRAFTKGMFGAGLSFPLNNVLPAVKQYAMKQSLQETTYTDAAARVLEYIEKYIASIRASEQGNSEQHAMPYLFYPTPSSCDALLFACLSMIRCFPVHNSLRQAAKPLDRYLDAIARNAMGTPITMGALADRTWAKVRCRSATHQQESQQQQKEEEEGTGRVGSKGTYWLMGVGTLFVAYIVLGGQYFEIQQV